MPTSSLGEVLRGRTGLSPIMVGRNAALQRLRGLIDSAEIAALDVPEVALVSGEPGIGKTRLLRELLERLPADVTVLSAQAQPGSLGRPFDVIGQLAPPGADPATGAAAAIEAAVATGRTVLLVEDLHWADAGTAIEVNVCCFVDDLDGAGELCIAEIDTLPAALFQVGTDALIDLNGSVGKTLVSTPGIDTKGLKLALLCQGPCVLLHCFER